MLRCLTSIGSATEREQEQELIDSLSDKSAIPQAIKDYRHQIGIGNRKYKQFSPLSPDIFPISSNLTKL